MNNEEMRIEIAKALGVAMVGWWCPSCKTEVAPAFVTYEETHDGCGCPVESMPIPNYPEDLNAMHDAEMTLPEEEYRLFIAHLVSILKPGEFAVRASAYQRCEAFLRVKGLWKEESNP